MTDCITDRTVSICTDGHPDIGYWTWVAGFAALRGAGEDDGQQDNGDDDGGAEEQVDGTVGEGAHTHGDAPISVGGAPEEAHGETNRGDDD